MDKVADSNTASQSQRQAATPEQLLADICEIIRPGLSADLSWSRVSAGTSARLSAPCASGVPSWCAMCDLPVGSCPCDRRRAVSLRSAHSPEGGGAR